MPEDKQNPSPVDTPSLPDLNGAADQPATANNGAGVNLADPGSNQFPQQPDTEEDISSKLEPAVVSPPPVANDTSVSMEDPPKSYLRVLLVVGSIVAIAMLAGLGWYYFAADDTSEETPIEEPAPIPDPVSEPIDITVDPLETEESSPFITGTVDDPSATVVVTVEGEDYTATVSDDGTWEVEIVQALEPGTYDILVVAENGDPATRTEVAATFVVIESEPEPEPEPEPVHEPDHEPEQTPTTGPQELPTTGPR